MVNPGHERFMRAALEQAKVATRLGEVPVGAVLVMDDTVVATGYNQSMSMVDPTAHAEIVALRAAARLAGNYRLTGSTLYVTVEPCLMCVGAMVHARIGTLVYGADEPKSGAICSTVHALELPGLNHHFEVVSGVGEEACRELIQGFFRQKRKAPEEEAGPPGSARGSGRP
jgi:tRNA(adenine34) deaminase